MHDYPDVGDIAPEIELESTDGRFSLYERLEDGAVLLVFYPRDNSLICTRQLCNYRDHLSRFENLDVQIAGINNDSSESHENFAARFKFRFPLVSDPDRVTCGAYGALMDLWKLRRVLVLVGQDRRIWWRHAEFGGFYRKAKELESVIAELRNEF